MGSSTASACDMQVDVSSSSDIESNLNVTTTSSISTSESKEIDMPMTFISLDALKEYVYSYGNENGFHFQKSITNEKRGYFKCAECQKIKK